MIPTEFNLPNGEGISVGLEQVPAFGDLVSIGGKRFFVTQRIWCIDRVGGVPVTSGAVVILSIHRPTEYFEHGKEKHV